MDSTDLKVIFAKNLKRFLDKKKINQSDLARSLGFPEMTVSNWLNAKTYPRMDKVQQIADYFKVQRSDLIEDKPTNLFEYNPQTVLVPVLGQIACGEPILVAENYSEYRAESLERLPSGKVFYLCAKGNSMEPTIPNGSLVLIREQSDIENGEIAAVLLNGDTEATLKRIKKQDDLVILMPDNPKFNPIIISKDNPARIIGKAIRYSQDL